MHKNLFPSFSSGFINVIGLIAFISMGACINNATATVESTKAKLTEALAIQTKTLIFTPAADAKMNESTPHVSPYIDVLVRGVEVRYLETNPVEVELVISGTLPDQCEYDFYSVENRTGQRVKVSVAGIHPANTDCEQTDRNIEYVLRLGRTMPEAERGFSRGDYTLTVNNYQTSFSIK